MEERYQHCIFVASNYTSGKRKGLHFLYNPANIKFVLERASAYSGKDGVSVYFITSNEPSIESVKKKDPFFENIDIIEGVKPSNVAIFNDSINNQITVIDVALLLISQDPMTVHEMKIYLFLCYYFYVANNGVLPFHAKCYIEDDFITFKEISAKFLSEKVDETSTRIKVTSKANVIMSKFFNCEGGVEFMNKVIQIYYNIRKYEIGHLEAKVKTFISSLTSLRQNSYFKKNNFNKGRYITRKDIENNRIEL